MLCSVAYVQLRRNRCALCQTRLVHVPTLNGAKCRCLRIDMCGKRKVVALHQGNKKGVGEDYYVT